MVESDEQTLSAPTYTFEYAPRTRYVNVEFQLPEYACAIYAGGDPTSYELTLTDRVLQKCLRRYPWPNLEHFHLLAATKVARHGHLSGGALSALLSNCEKIQSIVIVSNTERPRLLDDLGMLDLLQPPPRLVYVELVGFKVRRGAEVWIERPTEKTEKLEFVFGVKGEQKIYKGYSEVDAQCRT
jgi:hypothetical protein